LIQVGIELVQRSIGWIPGQRENGLQHMSWLRPGRTLSAGDLLGSLEDVAP
jgi:hypothetical protein